MPEVVAVVGAGLMGAGIAQVSAQAGYEVRLFDVEPESLDRGLAAIQRSVARLADKGVVSEDVETVTSRVMPTTSMTDFSTAFIGVEAVFERLDIKQDVFRSLDRFLPPDAILATNTSALPITKLAQVTSRPDRVVGTHFFSPVPMMQLCELVRGEQTSDQTLAKSRAFAENVGKTCVV
ncbi:MAG: 3-hydroxyacyl-CoA dehydrogenase family protein, partial [Actinomycetes bacterium]